MTTILDIGSSYLSVMFLTRHTFNHSKWLEVGTSVVSNLIITERYELLPLEEFIAGIPGSPATIAQQVNYVTIS